MNKRFDVYDYTTSELEQLLKEIEVELRERDGEEVEDE